MSTTKDTRYYVGHDEVIVEIRPATNMEPALMHTHTSNEAGYIDCGDCLLILGGRDHNHYVSQTDYEPCPHC